MKKWYVVYTKPKAEDATAPLLGNAGVEVLNPKIKIKKYIRKKYVCSIEQLFPCYLFASFDAVSESHMIRYTRGVKYIIGKENPLPVFPEIIEAIRERMDGDIVKPQPANFEKGERVLIKEGPFKDFYGVFEREMPGKERSMILLEALHCAVDIETRSIRKA